MRRTIIKKRRCPCSRVRQRLSAFSRGVLPINTVLVTVPRANLVAGRLPKSYFLFAPSNLFSRYTNSIFFTFSISHCPDLSSSFSNYNFSVTPLRRTS